MGNSNSQHLSQTHSYQPFHPALHQRGDLIRNGGPYPHVVGPPPPKMYNPECKVLPERIPGQKLRITDNGSILQNGGTLTGRPRVETTPPGPLPGDPEFMQYMMMRRRAEEMHSGNFMNKQGVLMPDARYYSHPDLATVQEVHADETDSSASGKRFRKKSRAPPPPAASSAMNGNLNTSSNDRPVSRTSSLREQMPPPHHGRPLEQGLVKVQPWQQREDLRAQSLVRMSMEKIIERHQAVVQESRPQSMPQSSRSSETLPWNHRKHETAQRYENRKQHPLPQPPHQRTTEITISHERRFYKNKLDNNSKKLSQSELQLNGISSGSDIGNRQMHLPDRAEFISKKQGHIENRQQSRAKSMDSLQIALQNESKTRLSVDNLNNDNYYNGNNDRPPSRQSRNSTENIYRPSSVDGRIWEEPKKWSSNHKSEIVYATGSLQRNLSAKAQYEQHLSSRKDHTPNERLRQRQYSPSSSRENISNHNASSSGVYKRDLMPPKQYYFGEGNEEPENTSIVSSRGRHRHHHTKTGSNISQPIARTESSGRLVKPPEHHKAESRGSGSRGLPVRESPLIDDFVSDGERLSNDLRRSTPSRESEINRSSQGRNRNSYAFEDRKFHYDIHAQREIAKEPINEPDYVLNGTKEPTSEDEMDISMQLRPTLPKRTPAIPRFSPTQAWRSLNLEHITSGQKGSDRSSDDGDVFEDRIHRVTRPVAPPRVGNERSADSGISQDAGSPGGLLADDLIVSNEKRSTGDNHNNKAATSRSPQPTVLLYPLSNELSSLETSAIIEPGISPVHHKRSTWTPEEDLASDFEGGSVDHTNPVESSPEMVSAPPKLTPMKSMFASRTFVNIEDKEKRDNKGRKSKSKGMHDIAVVNKNNNTPHTFNSLRKMKHSLSSVAGTSMSTRGKITDDLQNVDENWSFSRSLPNSLHNGLSGEELITSPSPKKENETSNFINQSNMRRAESGPIYPSSVFGGLQTRVFSLDCLNNDEPFTEGKGNANGKNKKSLMSYSKSEHIIYLPEYDAKKIILKEKENADFDSTILRNGQPSSLIYVGSNLKKHKKFTYQSTVRQQERRRLEEKLSQEVAFKEKQREQEIMMVSKVEEEFQKKREREKINICQQLKVLSDSSQDHDESSPTPPPPLMSASQLSLYTEEISSSSSPLSSQPSETFSKTSPHGKLEKQDSGFFSGISKWMRRQQKLEEQQQQQQQQLQLQLQQQQQLQPLQQELQEKHQKQSSNQEMEPKPQILRFDPKEFNRQMQLLDPSHEIINAAKFSTGEIPSEKQNTIQDQRMLYGIDEPESWQSLKSRDPNDIFPMNNGDDNICYPDDERNTMIQVHRSSSGRAVESTAEIKQHAEGRRRMNYRQQLGSNSSFGDSTASSESPMTKSDQNSRSKRYSELHPTADQLNGQKLRSSIESSDCSSEEQIEVNERPWKGHSRYKSPKNGRWKGFRDSSRSSSRDEEEEETTTQTSAMKRFFGRKRHDKHSKASKTNGHVEDVRKKWPDDRKKLPGGSSTCLNLIQPYSPNKQYRPIVYQPWLKSNTLAENNGSSTAKSHETQLPT